MDINDIVPEHRDYVKKQVEIISEKRNALLDKYGIIIRLDEGGLSNYKYTIGNGDFYVRIFSPLKNEIDTLGQIFNLMHLDEYTLALTEAKAYQDCLNQIKEVSSVDKKIYSVETSIRNKLKNARAIDIDKDLKQKYFDFIESIHCTNVIGLENKKVDLANLYTNLFLLRDDAYANGVDYELSIEDPHTPQKENI